MPPANENALNVQHGGSRYKSMAIQPVEYGTANAYDPCIFSAMKYVTRHPEKGREEDLNKAMHFVDLRLEMIRRHGPLRACLSTFLPSQYCMENGLKGLEYDVLCALHNWAFHPWSSDDEDTAEDIKKLIQQIIKRDYEKRTT